MPAMSSMSPRSCRDRVGWRALGGNRGKDDDESDAFERVSVEFACWVRVNQRCVRRKGNVRAFSLGWGANKCNVDDSGWEGDRPFWTDEHAQIQ